MKYIFFGTPRFAAIVLKKLVDAGLKPAALVCNPDEPVGRKKILTAPPTKMIAQANNIPIWQPQKLEIRNWELEIDKLGSVDLAIVAAYNKIIPQTVLDALPAKFIGVHPSLLPNYRGPSPIQTAILNGDKETGVNIFLIDKGVDHGPVLASTECEISEKDNYETMEAKLATLGAELLIENLQKYLDGKIKPVEQNHEKATFTKKFSTEDGKVELPTSVIASTFAPLSINSAKPCLPAGRNLSSNQIATSQTPRNDKAEKASAELIFNKIRALNPDPGVFAFIDTKSGKKRVKLLEAKLNPTHKDVYGTKDGKPFGGAQDKLELLRVQPEGKKPMSYKDFLNGLKNG